jgi:hypothetical protein
VSTSTAGSKSIRIGIKTRALLCGVLVLLCAFVLSSSSLSLPSASIVHNPNTGWEKSKVKQIELVEELVIGTEGGDANYMVGRVTDIATDSKRNIYIADNGYSRIQMFDSEGGFIRTVGSKGEGPGEFGLITAITTDAQDNLYVADMSSRIKIFGADGKYIDQFKHNFPGTGIRSIKTDQQNNLFLSCLDIFEQQVIHKYSAKHKHLRSFCDSWAVGDNDVDVRLEGTFGGGTLDLDADGNVYYTQMTPYEIRKFSPDGDLLLRIYRENSFMRVPEPQVVGETMRVTMPTTSTSIVVLQDGRFINIVKKPPVPDPPPATILDLFDESGHLLFSRRYDKDMNIKSIDNQGRLYALDASDYPCVIRYRLSVRQ